MYEHDATRIEASHSYTEYRGAKIIHITYTDGMKRIIYKDAGGQIVDRYLPERQLNSVEKSS
jgi:hypothetical protein